MQTLTPPPGAGYTPRSFTNTFKEIVEQHLEEMLAVYDERFAATFGPIHPRVKELFERFLRCGDPHFGFMRLHCESCGENKYVPFSCKTRGLCPSCGQKRAILLAERLSEEVLPDVPYVQLVFTIPKILRKAFLFRRKLYGELCRSAYAATRDFFREQYPRLDEPVPAFLATPQSFGSLLNSHPHAHTVCSLGVFDQDGTFHPVPGDLDFAPLEDIFREHTFKVLLKNEAITAERIEMLRNWHHSGFHVDASRRVSEGQRDELEKLLGYMLRPPVALNRLSYGVDSMVTCRGKFNPSLGRDYQHVSAVEFLAMLVPHILLRFECSIRSYGALSTTLRRKFGWVDSEARPEVSAKGQAEEEESEFVRQRRKTWARLIRKVWLEDPELCPRCGEKMRVIAVISSPAQDDVIEKILRATDSWDPPWLRKRSASKARAPPQGGYEDSFFDQRPEGEDDFSQLPPEGAEHWDI